MLNVFENSIHLQCFPGVFIESPPEAAMRELKEETGIKLKLSDVTSSPYVDVPQTDNLNPHKGRHLKMQAKQPQWEIALNDAVLPVSLTELNRFCLR